MPSLILELTEKTNKKRIEQANKWFIDTQFFHGITREHFTYLEIIFRQLIMHEKFNTAFVYENERPTTFPIKSDKFVDTIEPYIKESENKRKLRHPSAGTSKDGTGQQCRASE